jgi:hypothetical protein
VDPQIYSTNRMEHDQAVILQSETILQPNNKKTDDDPQVTKLKRLIQILISLLDECYFPKTTSALSQKIAYPT